MAAISAWRLPVHARSDRRHCGPHHTLTKNPTSMYVIELRSKPGVVRGYWCVLPLSEQNYRAIIEGNLRPTELDAEKVLSQNDECGFYYVGSLVAVGARMRAGATRGFEDFIRSKADIHYGLHAGSIRVLARAATKDGLRMIERNSFEHIAGTTGLGGLYERSFLGRTADPKERLENSDVVTMAAG
jgi:hypothetical protein